MRSPCYGCEFRHEDKDCERCYHCELRVQAWACSVPDRLMDSPPMSPEILRHNPRGGRLKVFATPEQVRKVKKILETIALRYGVQKSDIFTKLPPKKRRPKRMQLALAEAVVQCRQVVKNLTYDEIARHVGTSPTYVGSILRERGVA